MGNSRFNPPSRSRIAVRVFPLATFVFVLAMPVMDSVSRQLEAEGLGRVPSAVSLAPDAAPVVVVSPDAGHFERTQAFFQSFPQVCLKGTEVNDLQRERCQGLWSKAWIMAGVASLPFLAFFLMLGGFLQYAGAFYGRVRRQVRQGQPTFSGRVSRREGLDRGLFGYFLGMNRVAVEAVGQRKQVWVYLPESEPLPLPGQTLSVFDAGKAWGKSRFFGVLYAPHLAVH